MNRFLSMSIAFCHGYMTVKPFTIQYSLGMNAWSSGPCEPFFRKAANMSHLHQIVFQYSIRARNRRPLVDHESPRSR